MASYIHPQLGNIKHLLSNGIRHFRGLKYASLEHAFAVPRIQQGNGEGRTIDATHFGPTAVSPPMGCDMELSLIQKPLPHKTFPMSTTECLNLNMSIPENHSGALPVFIFLHGGGYTIGSNAWPQYDLARLIQLSQDMKKPVIGITINYRLGVYGFLDSSNLRKAGVNPNRGLQDQQAALKWIQENIEGFGGDPKRVTLIGESAGGVSGTLHIQSEELLFQQLVAMGGTSLLLKPLSPPVSEIMYASVLERLQIDSKQSPEDQLKSLLAITPETILSSVGPDLSLLPVIDGNIITSDIKFAQWSSPNIAAAAPGIKRCRRVMFGDCQFDGSIMAFVLMPRKDNLVESFQTAMKAYVSDKPTDLEPIYKEYDISSGTPSENVMKNILRFINDVQFYIPVVTMAKAWPGSAFVYHFNERNPWEGPHKGEANHILDVAFLFQNFNDYLEVDQVKSAQRFGRDIITFVNGEDPYPKYNPQSGGAQVYGSPFGPQGGFVISVNPADYGRRAFVWQLGSKLGWDKLSTALDRFIAGI
ncbi:para-nitrobenzyl esterase [Curvularia clavata]|uniref:Carboxylic ester hydrolase n=1 Tax=Curvularia clavata TaxID=95742 RepID=A0A9Q8Z3E2_CURCL|nr:para-nitrobenzyl esterase [Curvularia clavata]